MEDPQELKRIIERLILHSPAEPRTLMGWDPERDDLETADFSPMIKKVLTVRFHER